MHHQMPGLNISGHPIPQLRKLALSLGQHLIFRWKARIRGSLDVTVANTMGTRRGWLRPSAINRVQGIMSHIHAAYLSDGF